MKRILLMLRLTFCCLGGTFLPAGIAAENAVPESSLRYRVAVRGVTQRRLDVSFKHLLNTMALRDQPPPDAAMLERRALADVPRLQRALEARGYYDARIEVAVKPSRADRYRVVFRVRPGERFSIGEMTLSVEGDQEFEPPPIPDSKREPLRAGRPAVAGDILAAESALVDFYLENGFPFAGIAERSYWLNHQERRLHGRLLVSTGPEAVFGTTTIAGNVDVRSGFLFKLLPWSAGDSFNAGLVATAQRNMYRDGLFDYVLIEPDEFVAPDASLPMSITVRERPKRTVSLSARYRTDDGIGGGIQWMHRNLAGAGEQLNVSLDASEISTAIESQARKPAFRRHDQSLIANLSVMAEYPDAYSSRHVLAAIRIERQPRRFLLWSLGKQLKTGQVRQSGETDRTTMFGVPMRIAYDSRLDPMDPLQGIRLVLETVPMLELPEGDPAFVKIRPVVGGVYAFGHGNLRLAAQTRWTVLAGAAHGKIPADERLYAGGGGSVRGYAYQSLGPYVDDRPQGGRSMIENMLEMRWRMNERIGWCGFVDAGQAYLESLPRSSDWAWTAGAGVRYYLPRFGPLRFDFAVPLERRPERDDDAYQFYVSLGQAF